MAQQYQKQYKVTEDYIDHNEHMHDAYYNIVFSEVINHFNYTHGMSLEERHQLGFTLFTLEEHTTYLAELALDQHFTVVVYIYDYDDKRIHFFLEMYRDDDNTLAATNEVMMMCIDESTRRSGVLPEKAKELIKAYYQQQNVQTWPEQLGHRIAIPRKGAN